MVLFVPIHRSIMRKGKRTKKYQHTHQGRRGGVAHVGHVASTNVIWFTFFLHSPSKPPIFDLLARKTQNPPRTEARESTHHR